MENLPENAQFKDFNPSTKVLHPMNCDIKGNDNLGSLLIFKNNRAWWTGSVMDTNDSKKLLGGKYGPTPLQVIGGVYAGFSWMMLNQNSGNRYPDWIDTDFVLSKAMPYIGSYASNYVDLNQSHIKDCYKLQDFLVGSKQPTERVSINRPASKSIVSQTTANDRL